MALENTQKIFLTDQAIGHFQKMHATVIRIAVKNSGCSGKSYVVDIISDNDIKSNDEVYEFSGIKICIDPESLIFLAGTEIDYSKKNLLEGHLVFKNPQEKSHCGCGESFYV